MCLKDRIPAKNPTGFGYKAFGIRDGKLVGDWQNLSKIRPINKWLNEQDYRTNIPPIEGFGWHIFKNLKDAKEYIILYKGMKVFKIKYRNALMQGTTLREFAGITAKEILILPNQMK